VIGIGLRQASTNRWHFAHKVGDAAYADEDQESSWNRTGIEYVPFVGEFDVRGRSDLALFDSQTGKWFFFNRDTKQEYRTFEWPGMGGGRCQGFVGNFELGQPTYIGVRDTQDGKWHFARWDPGAQTFGGSQEAFYWPVVGHDYEPFVGDFAFNGTLGLGLRTKVGGRIFLAHQVGDFPHASWANELTYWFHGDTEPGDIQILSVDRYNL
jgi:hypothetical protein